MSLLIYNGVSLPYPLTTQFTQEAVRDDSPGGIPTDWICTKFDITVQTIINADYILSLAPDIAGTTSNPVDIMKVIRSRLLAQRKVLSFTMNGRELIPAILPGNKGGVDVRNGPQPQSCTIMELTNTSFLMTYRIVAHYWENNKVTTTNDVLTVTNRTTSPILFNRWTETVDMDSCQMSTRTREGKFMIRSDNSQGRIADEMRNQMAVVSLPEGFLRASSRYTVSTDGLAIAYTVVDKEVFKMPPQPAFEAEGEYTESCNKAGAIRYADVRVKLKGDNSNKATRGRQDELVVAVFSIVTIKLRSRGAGILLEKNQKEPNGLIESFSIRTWMYENIVECSARVMFKFNGVLLFNAPGVRSNVTFTPLSDFVDYSPLYQARGTANLLLQAAAYYDPNLQTSSLRPAATTLVDGPVLDGDIKIQMPGVQPGKAGKDGE